MRRFMTGCRIVLTFVLILGLAVQASAAPVIVQIGPLSSILSIVAALGGSLLDTIPGTNIYLLNLPLIPSPLLSSLLGIQWLEPNKEFGLTASPVPLLLSLPGSTTPDWYRHQPPLMMIHSADALAYSKGRGVVVADLNSKVD